MSMTPTVDLQLSLKVKAKAACGIELMIHRLDSRDGAPGR